MGKKGLSLHAKSLKDLCKTQSAEQMLAEDKRNLLLQQIQENCALETERFNSLCLTVINNLINHCQSLPDSSNSYYSQQGGLLDYALNRTDAALGLFKEYVVLDEKEVFSEEQKLWQYALLTAAVLQGIGKLHIDYEVDIYDNNGQFLKPWNPLLENLVLTGSHYSYSFQKNADETFRRRLNLLLARTLMPASGFAWIASNPQVLATWLALLNEDPHSAGTLGAILIRADALAIQRYLNQLAAKKQSYRAGIYGRSGTFTGGTPEKITEIEQQIGIEFIQWLANSLTSGLIMINKAPLLMVPGGMLMCPDIFKYFVRAHPEYKNLQAIQNGFLALNLHSRAPDGEITSRFEQNGNQQIHTGIFLPYYAVALPAEVPVFNAHTGKTQTVSTVDLIHQAQYNHQFTRQPFTVNNPSLSHLYANGWQADKPAIKSSPNHGVTHSV